MFETSVVQDRVQAAARRPLLFSLSIGAHVAAVAGIVTMSVAGVTLPRSAPRQVMIPVFTELKPMLGDNGSGRKQPVPEQKPAQKPAPAAVVAPSVVPSQVPQVATTAQTSASTDVSPAAGDNTNSNTGTPGVPWGTKDGVVPDGPPVATDASPAKIYEVKGDVKAPTVLRRVTPPYPEIARKMRLNGFAIVECIIDTNGKVRDAHIVRSSFAAFEQPALDAIYGWQFSPGTLNGTPVNVQFDLTVTFQVR